MFEFGLLDLHMVIFPFILSADGPGKTHQRWPPVASPKIAWPKTALAKDRFGKTASARPLPASAKYRFGKRPLWQKAASARPLRQKAASAKGRFGKTACKTASYYIGFLPPGRTNHGLCYRIPADWPRKMLVYYIRFLPWAYGPGRNPI